MEYLLGTDYILSDMGARSPLPGMQAQSLHRDGGPFVPNPPYNVHSILPLSAQSLIALSEFTRKNGATRFVPASHLRDIEPQDVPPAQEELLLCEPGTALIYDSRLIHGGSANTSDQIRYAIQGFCCRGNHRPFCDHTRSIPPEIVAGATPLMRRLWGFESQSAWEQSPRDFKIVEAPGAKPHFDYNRRRGGQRTSANRPEAVKSAARNPYKYAPDATARPYLSRVSQIMRYAPAANSASTRLATLRPSASNTANSTCVAWGKSKASVTSALQGLG